MTYHDELHGLVMKNRQMSSKMTTQVGSACMLNQIAASSKLHFQFNMVTWCDMS